MRALLDSHTLLWWFFDDRRLSARVRGILANGANEIFVSSATGGEIATKHRLGKLPYAGAALRDLPGTIARAGFDVLPISLAHAIAAGSLAGSHRDPFDRMLAAQARIEGTPLLTDDAAFATLGVVTLW